ncbi:MAG: MoxR family ATPase [Candidatus Cloacimonetes bacterium]|nr:MoxR family ATPase [Candidatus Cloacimonadota bacterium]MCF7813572.1 MoxR family ATPase [Candidatus Cloacimonadota bacterium]MCF7868203.1 MoxR family ATPase [Candidatus Cloacimonadota bacterium]MCF7883633.1 MoxR family ATPase [Candidatus Cloacimonadota bacterium]
MTIEEINQKVIEKSQIIDTLNEEIGKVVVGQKYMIKRMLVGLLADGHILLEGVPGLAKTLAVNTVANTIKASFKRLQFTPDLLPADLVGTLIYNQKSGEFVPKKGPIFANFILADEINRAPAKVQSALLESMQERQVTIGDTTYPLPKPFLVMATQNPLEQEGTYPLPEAQVDRFMLKLLIDYPSRAEENLIMEKMVRDDEIKIKPVLKPKEILEMRNLIKDIYMENKVKDYILDLVFATRNPQEYKNLSELKDLIECGASPRASIFLARAAKAHAFLEHRGYVTPDDIKAIGKDILRHRIILTYEAEAEQISQEDIVNRLFDEIEVP